MKTPFLGQSYVARSVNAAANRLVNLFPEPTPENGKDVGFFTRAPGLRLLDTESVQGDSEPIPPDTDAPLIPEIGVGTGPIRGLWTFNGSAYIVSGTGVYRMGTNLRYTRIGTVTGTGPVSMADNGTQLFIACNPDAFVYNAATNTFAQVGAEGFPGAVTVGYLDGYFVFNAPNSQQVWVTSLLDGLSIDPLDFASAEGSPDRLVSLIVDHREVWLFGSNSVEVWYNAGSTDFPLQRIQGAYNEIGCVAPYSVAKLDNSVFWLGADARGNGIVYRAEGYQGKRISTHAIEWQIQQYGMLSDAVAFTYQQEGHAFYVLNFPTANTTWVYDVSTAMWHERASWNYGAFARHRANCQVNFNNQIIVGDYANNKLYALDTEVYSDAGNPQRWLRSWRALGPGQNNLTRTAHHTLQLDCESGVGLTGIDTTLEFLLNTESSEQLLTEEGDDLLVEVATTQGVNPKVMLRWSDDGGHTWSNEHWVEIGRVGEYGRRAIWRRLGMTLKLRDRVYEVSGTDPVKLTLLGAELRASGTRA